MGLLLNQPVSIIQECLISQKTDIQNLSRFQPTHRLLFLLLLQFNPHGGLFFYISHCEPCCAIYRHFAGTGSYIYRMSWKEDHPGFISVLSSLDSQPIEKILEKWQSKVRNGHIKRITDPDIELPVFEISGSNVVNNLIAFPSAKSGSMKMKMPVLVLLVKNMDKYFRFEVTVLDDKNVKRTFISANNQSITRIKPFECSMPLQLDDGWNQIVFDLQDYCEKAFGSQFVECQRVQVHANCRLARIYFNDSAKTQDEIPADYKLFMRVQSFKC